MAAGVRNVIAAPLPPGRRAGVWLARLTIVVLVSLFLGAGWVVPHPQPYALITLGVAAVAGIVYLFTAGSDTTRAVWLTFLTLAAWGRALGFLFLGADDLSRARELVAAGTWAVAFFAGVCATLILTAERILRG